MATAPIKCWDITRGWQRVASAEFWVLWGSARLHVVGMDTRARQWTAEGTLRSLQGHLDAASAESDIP